MSIVTRQEYQKNWRQANKAKLNDYFRQYHMAHREARLARNNARYHANKAAQLAQQKQRYQKNRSAILAKQAEYSKAHSCQIVEKVANWQKANPEKVRAAKKKYENAHRAENRIRVKARRAKMRGSVIDQIGVLSFYKSVRAASVVTCSYCGIPMAGKDAHIDHIIPIAKGGAHSPDNLCPACPKCNQAKGAKSKEEFLRQNTT